MQAATSNFTWTLGIGTRVCMQALYPLSISPYFLCFSSCLPHLSSLILSFLFLWLHIVLLEFSLLFSQLEIFFPGYQEEVALSPGYLVLYETILNSFVLSLSGFVYSLLE